MDEKIEPDIEYKCLECGELFPKELVTNYIQKNKKVYCEKCGSQYVYGSNDRIKAGSKNERDTKKYRVEKSNVKRYNSYESKTKSYHDYKDRPEISGTTHFNKSKVHSRKTTNSELKGIKVAISTINGIVKSPLFIIIGIIITIGRIVSLVFIWNSLNFIIKSSTIVDIILRMIMLIVVYKYVSEKVADKISDGDFSSFGFDTIAIGIMAVECYGLGILVIIDGFLVLVYEILIRRNNLIEQIETPDEFNYMLLSANITEQGIQSVSSILIELTVLSMILGLPALISNLFLLVPFFASLYMIHYIKNKFLPKMNSVPLNETEDEVLTWGIIFGAISIFYSGTGIYLLGLSILIFVYKGLIAEIEKKAQTRRVPKRKIIYEKTFSDNNFSNNTPPSDGKPVPTENDIKKGQGQLVAYSSNQERTENKKNKIQPASIKINDLKGLEPIPEEKILNNKVKPEKKLQKIPLLEVEESRSELIDALSSKKGDKKLGLRTPSDMKTYLDRIFTILTEDMRSRLLSLDIPEKQKWDIIQEFTNLKEEEQEKYLKELENVNRKISKKLLKRIMNMDLKAGEKQALIEQLKLLPPETRQEFIEFLEVQH